MLLVIQEKDTQIDIEMLRRNELAQQQARYEQADKQQ